MGLASSIRAGNCGIDLNTNKWGLHPVSEPEINILLVGRTGNGKSSTGNSLLGKEIFKTRRSAAGFTERCEAQRGAAMQDGPRICVIDTPGLFDFSVTAKHVNREIRKCFDRVNEGLHVVFLVLSVRTRITQEEESTFNELQVIFGNKIIDHTVVLFTGGDSFEEDETLDDYLYECPEFLKAVLRMCGGRKVVFDNRTTNEGKMIKQVQEVMAHVATIYQNNDGNVFTEEMCPKTKDV